MSPTPKDKVLKTATLMIPPLPTHINTSSSKATTHTTRKSRTTQHHITSTTSSSDHTSSSSSFPLNITSDSISVPTNFTNETPVLTNVTADNFSSIAAPLMVGSPSLQPIASQSSESSPIAAIIGGSIIGAIFVFGLVFFTLRRTRLKQGGLRHFSVHPFAAAAGIHSSQNQQEPWEDASSQNHLSSNPGSNFADPYHTSQLNIDQQPSPPPPVAMVDHHNQNKTEYQRYVPQLNIPLPGTPEEEDGEYVNPSHQYLDHRYQPEPIAPYPAPGRGGHAPHSRPPIPAEFVFPLPPEPRANEEDDEYGEAY